MEKSSNRPTHKWTIIRAYVNHPSSSFQLGTVEDDIKELQKDIKEKRNPFLVKKAFLETKKNLKSTFQQFRQDKKNNLFESITERGFMQRKLLIDGRVKKLEKKIDRLIKNQHQKNQEAAKKPKRKTNI